MTISNSRFLSIAALALTAGLAGAQTFTISAAFAPNAFGSPSYNAFASNFITGIQTGANTVGDQSLPTGYQNVIGGNFDARRNVATNFQAFNGQAGFGGAAFADELGNRLTFGLNIVSPTTFILANLEDGTSSSIADSEGFDIPLESYAGLGFNSSRIGIFYGADGVKGTSDDVVYDSSAAGDDQTPINEISLISFGVANAATTPNTPGASDQDRIDFAGREYGDYTLTGLFRLNGGAVQSGTVTFAQPVPEPATMAALGFGALALVKRRKKAAK